MVGPEYKADFTRESAKEFKFLEMKTKEIQSKEKDRCSMSVEIRRVMFLGDDSNKCLAI